MAPSSWAALQERSPFAALPDGWSVIGRCRFGTGGPGPKPTGCYALAHPKVGVALIDIIPHATPNAEARLRRALTAVEFWPDFPGTLPVVHDRLDAAALPTLPRILERWFATLPALTVPGGSAWIEGVRRAMAVDPAWELPGQPKAMPGVSAAPVPDIEPAAAAPQAKQTSSARSRRWGRLALLPLGFVAVFGAGLAAGFLLLEARSPAGQIASVAAPSPVGAAAGVGSTALPPEASSGPVQNAVATPQPSRIPVANAEAPKRAEAVPPPAEPASGLALAAAPAATPALRSEPPPPLPAVAEAPSHAALEVPAVRMAAGPAFHRGFAADSQSLETPVAHALPMAPPRAPPPPLMRTGSSQPGSRPAPGIDRACSQALFRFQQGERLTAAEQNFVRTGCSSGRR